MFDTEKRQKCILYTSLLSILAFKLMYIFAFTDYAHYLTSDAKGYWDRAIDRYNANLFLESQWAVFPPFYHIFLAFLFKIYSLFNIFEYRLEVTIVLNALLSTISTYAIYTIVKRVTKNWYISFFAMLNYALIYTVTYFNAFILSENLATPLIIIAVAIFLRRDRVSLILSGVIFAFAVATRSNLIVIVPFLLLLLIERDRLLYSLKSLAIFLTSFGVVISLVVIENNYISKGEVNSLSANGGVNLYIALCKPKSITSKKDGLIYSFGVSEYCLDENLEDVTVYEKFYNQKYFVDLAIECIEKNPNIWSEKFEDLKNIFFANMYPTYFSAKGFEFSILTSRYMLYFMSLTILALFFLPLFFKSIDRATYSALLGGLILSFGTLYIFNFDHRLIYPIAFLILIIFYIILYSILKLFKGVKSWI